MCYILATSQDNPILNEEQAISSREWALCQLTVCFQFQSRSERTFPVTTDLLNREFRSSFSSAICYKCNSYQVTTDLLNSENMNVAIALLCNETQVCNFSVL